MRYFPALPIKKTNHASYKLICQRLSVYIYCNKFLNIYTLAIIGPRVIGDCYTMMKFA